MSESNVGHNPENPHEAEDVMSRLKKDWNDLAARSSVSEVGLDVDRAELIRRYREEEKLTQKEIADGVGLGQQRIGQLLIYGRYIAGTSGPSTRISSTRFAQYWKQVSDPSETRGKGDSLPPNPTAKQLAAHAAYRVYEAQCFADIRKLVEAGKPPMKRQPKPKAVTSQAVIRDVTAAARRLFKPTSPLRVELARLKKLSGAERDTYAPTLLADAATIIEREINALFKLLTEAGKNAPAHEQSAPTNADN